MGGKIAHILISDLRQEVYYARIVIEVAGDQIEIDSRPSDAIALAVRAAVPVFVNESVMDKAAREPDEDIEKESPNEPGEEKADEKRLSAFADFVDTLDLDDLDDREE